MLSETLGCGDFWSRCHSPQEVRNMKDLHIDARISQFQDNREGVDIKLCDVVKEYLDSGRADQIEQTTEGSCTSREVIYFDFQLLHLTQSKVSSH